MGTTPQGRATYVAGMKVVINPNTSKQITQDDVSGTLETLAYSAALRKEDKYVRYAPAAFVSSGGANQISINLSDDYPTVYTANIPIRFQSPISNSGTTSINVNSIGALNLYKEDQSLVASGEILQNSFYEFVYNSDADGSGTAGFTLYEGIGGTGSDTKVAVQVTGTTKTISTSEDVYVFTGSSACAVTLPAGATSLIGRRFTWINSGTADCTFNDAGGETLKNSDPFVIYAGTAYDFMYTGISGYEWIFI